MSNNKINRIDWIDVAKGIAIVLTIVGHTVDGYLRGFIFSFHMPLFFILSGATMKFSSNGDEFLKRTQKAFKSLIVPAFLMFVLNSCIWLSGSIEQFADVDYVKGVLMSHTLIGVFASGANVPVLGTFIPPIGIPWFFVVLFFGRVIYDYLNLRYSKVKANVICVVFSIVGYIFSRVQWLPLSFDIVFIIMPLFAIGREAARIKVEEKKCIKFAISLISWLALWFGVYMLTDRYLEFACRSYPLYPLCFIVAILGTIVVSEFGAIISGIKVFKIAFKYLGRNSLYLLCVHILDYPLLKMFWEISDNLYINAAARLFVDVTMFLLFMLFKKLINNIKHPNLAK